MGCNLLGNVLFHALFVVHYVCMYTSWYSSPRGWCKLGRKTRYSDICVVVVDGYRRPQILCKILHTAGKRIVKTLSLKETLHVVQMKAYFQELWI